MTMKYRKCAFFGQILSDFDAFFVLWKVYMETGADMKAILNKAKLFYCRPNANRIKVIQPGYYTKCNKNQNTLQ